MRRFRADNPEYRERELARKRAAYAADPMVANLKQQIRKNIRLNQRDEEVLRGYTEAQG